METQKLPGGNTAEFYLAEGEKIDGEKYARTGTIAKSEMLCKVHPDVATVVRRFSRVHHHVDYSGFRANKLVLREGLEIPAGANDYGMKLVKNLKDRRNQ